MTSTACALEAPTARLLLSSDAPHEEWLEARRSGIGGSDVAAILGLGGGKYTSPRHVYEAKHGRPEEVDSEAMEMGREIEGFISHMFTKRSGLPTVMPPGMLVHAETPWMLANVDRYTLDGAGVVVAPLECKNRSEYQIADWEDGKTPDAPAIQLHWYLAVGGWSHGYVAALVGGNKLRWQRIERDEEMIGYLVDYCGKWFERHVLEGFPPPVDGLEATTKLFAKLWSVKAEDVAEIDLAQAKALRARRAELKATEKELTEELRLVENEMRFAAGESEIVLAEGKPAWTWKQNGPFASKKFREAEPDIAAEYTHQIDAIDTDRLKEERPELYASYRARTLYVPVKGV